jgi:hypothetical protein
MLITNQRIDKLLALQVDLISCGLFSGMGGVLNLNPAAPPFGDPDAVQMPGPKVLNVVTLAAMRGSYKSFPNHLHI